MRIASAISIITAFAVVATCVEGGFACQCGGGFRGKSAWDYARLAEQRTAVAFEGTPIKFELKWSLLTAKEGELIPADVWSGRLDYLGEPSTVITFRVSRTYKGNLGSEVQLHTGLGGGDCAATYVPGLSYLVYAGGPSLDQLTVSMCSPGGWIEDTEVATQLRYLRKERATPEDLAPIRTWSERNNAKDEARQRQAYDERRKRYEGTTGKVCGTLVADNSNDGYEGSIAFLSTLGYFPFSPTYGQINKDKSFCSPGLGPGMYYLYFVRRNDQGATALYYPGVTDVAKATPIEITAGQTQSHIVFKAETQSAYSVRGTVFADKKPDFSSNGLISDIMVLLIRSDGDRRVWYSEKAFFVSKVGYFKFENVVPGRYYAFVQTPGSGWLTRKVELDVTTHMKFISLDLVHKK